MAELDSVTATAVLRSADTCRRRKEEEERDGAPETRSSSINLELR